MSNTELAVYLIGVFCGGTVFGILIGQIITLLDFKKKVKSECGKCRHFEECLGMCKLKKSNENKDCRFFQKRGKKNG